MSEKILDEVTMHGSVQATKAATGSGSEQRRAAPGVYDAGHLTTRGNDRWADWQDRGAAIGDRLSSAVPNRSQAVSTAGDYVSRNVQEYPLSGLLTITFLGWVLGYFLPGRSS
jgi:hypothetical protein